MAATYFDYTVNEFDGGNSFANAGPFLEIKGKAYLTIALNLEVNKVINDIEYAPTDHAGLVRYSADFVLLRPLETGRGNGRLLFDVPNRGRRVVLNRMNQLDPPPELGFGSVWPGDAWPLKKGYSILTCGWQHDISPDGDWVRIQSPIPIKGGKPITGNVLCRTQPESDTNEWFLSHAGHQVNTPSDLKQETAVLTVKDNLSDPAGNIIPRHKWSFGRKLSGVVVPCKDTIYFEDGFEAGLVYELVYKASGTPLTGIGLAAMRDVASHFRHDLTDLSDPLYCGTERSYGVGYSQSGAVLRQFLFMGLNADELGRQVFDGVLSFIGGGRRSTANWRFAQLSAVEPPNTGLIYPHTDFPDDDPAGGVNEGIMTRAIRAGCVPKTIYINTSAEYWMAQAALVHTKINGEDAEIPHNVRVYMMSGTQHVGFNLPLTNVNAGPLADTKAQTFFNVNDWKPLGRAALENMDAWVSSDIEPPANTYPKVSDGTAVKRENLRDRLKELVGVEIPTPLIPFLQLDFGQSDGSWVANTLPPKVGEPYPDYVSDVDEDGNEVTGIRLPDVAVPLATYTGWHSRHQDMGGPGKQLLLSGSTIPFARTMEERKSRNDPRLSIQERYPSKTKYLELVGECARQLIAERYVLKEDYQLLLDKASEKFDAFLEISSPLPD